MARYKHKLSVSRRGGRGTRSRVTHRHGTNRERIQRIALDLFTATSGKTTREECYICATNMVEDGDPNRSPICPECHGKKPQDLPNCLQCQANSYG
jgi:hypothetical protein